MRRVARLPALPPHERFRQARFCELEGTLDTPFGYAQSFAQDLHQRTDGERDGVTTAFLDR